MCQFVDGVHATLPYGLAVFLVRSMLKGGGGGSGGGGDEGGGGGENLPPSEKLVGWTTGALAACWSLAQFCTSMPWGRVSDAGLGRKPLLAMSAVSSGVSVLLFGSSRSLAAAALSRLVGGAFNCTSVALKCVIAESFPSGQQSGPMSFMALAWGCGTIVGPALSALADPCSKSGGWVARSAALCRSSAVAAPDPTAAAKWKEEGGAEEGEGKEGLFRRHPYLLPCVAAAALSASAVVNAILVMEETLPAIAEKRRQRRRRRGPERRRESILSSLSSSLSSSTVVFGGCLSSRSGSLRRVMTFSSPYALVGASALRNGDGRGESNGCERGDALELSKIGERSGLLAPPSLQQKQQQRSPLSMPPVKRREQPRAPPSASAAPTSTSAGDDDAELGKSSTDANGNGSGNGASPATPPAPPSPSSSPRPPPPPPLPEEEGTADASSVSPPWHRLPQVRLALCGYGSVAFLYNLLDELVPIFASAAERDGGLGWDPSQLAPPLALGGLSLILWSQLGYPRLQRRAGTLRAARCGLAGMAPCCLLLAAPSLAPAGLPRAASLSLLLVLRSCFANNAFTSSMVLVNEAAPPGSIGLVNGAGQTLASATRAVGPALGSGASPPRASGRPWGSSCHFSS